MPMPATWRDTSLRLLDSPLSLLLSASVDDTLVSFTVDRAQSLDPNIVFNNRQASDRILNLDIYVNFCIPCSCSFISAKGPAVTSSSSAVIFIVDFRRCAQIGVTGLLRKHISNNDPDIIFFRHCRIRIYTRVIII